MIKLKSLKTKNNARVLFGFLIVLFLFFVLISPAIVSAGDRSDAEKQKVKEIFESFEASSPMLGGANIVAGNDGNQSGVGFIAGLGFALIGGLLYLISMVVAVITMYVAHTLQCVIDPSFFSSMPYTSVEDNPVIKVGWPITRGLSYMFIAIGIMVIGVATALGQENYGAKKALPLLIIMAVLVNFTPVICGVLVDASNLLMNAFLEKAGSTVNFVMKQMKVQTDLAASITNLSTFSPKNNSSIAASMAVFVIIDFLLIIVLLAFTFLFLVRHIAIWILVVLSPLAFVAYILPYTRKYWEEWWKQFISWCLAGIIAAFFLYLSFHLMDEAGKIFVKDKIDTTKIDELMNDPKNVMQSFFILVTIAVLLIIGLFLTISGAPTGTKVVLSSIKSSGKKLYEKTEKFATGGIKKGIGRITEGTTEKEIRKENRVKDAQKQLRGMNQGTVNRELKAHSNSIGSAGKAKREAAAKTLLYEKNDLGGDYDLTDDIKKDVIDFGIKNPNYQKAILSKRPDWAPEIEHGYGTHIEPEKKIESIKKAMYKINPKDFAAKVQPEALKNKDVVFSIAENNNLFKAVGGEKTSPAKKVQFKETFLRHPTQDEQEKKKQDPEAVDFSNKRLNEMASDPKWQTGGRTKVDVAKE